MRALVPAAVLVLAACGSGNQSNPSGSPDIMNGSANAPEQRQSARGTAAADNINCNGIQRGNGADVVGVTIGMSADDAFRAVACSNPALRVSFSNQGGFGPQALPDGRTMRKTITAEAGQERIQVSLVGLPGQERVVAIRRSINFERGQEPSATTLIAELQQKYGALDHNPNQYGAWSGRSLRDANNQPLSSEGPNGTLVGSQCSMGLLQDNLIGECGLSVGVEISLSRENQQLASRLVVSMSNGSFGVQQVEAVRAQAQGQAEQRQSQEVQNAQGRSPNL